MDWSKKSRNLVEFESLRTAEDGKNDSRMWREMSCADEDGRLKKKEGIQSRCWSYMGEK